MDSRLKLSALDALLLGMIVFFVLLVAVTAFQGFVASSSHHPIDCDFVKNERDSLQQRVCELEAELEDTDASFYATVKNMNHLIEKMEVEHEAVIKDCWEKLNQKNYSSNVKRRTRY